MDGRQAGRKKEGYLAVGSISAGKTNTHIEILKFLKERSIKPLRDNRNKKKGKI